MKKYIILIALMATLKMVNAQVWVEGFAFNSSPMLAYFNSGETRVKLDGFEAVFLDNKDLFATFAEPSFGGGINLRYARKRLVAGIELSFLKYQPKTELLSINMFRIGPFAEYYFMAEKKLKPYVGAEISLNNAKAFFNGDVMNAPQISQTYFGVGARAGLVYQFDEKWAARFGVKYAYLQLPYLDFSLGFAYNFGDF